jgi:ribonuclease HI
VAAFVVTDATGALVAQETVGPFDAANVAVVELVAIHAAMDWLLAHGHHEVCIRTDFLPVVEALVNGTIFGGAAAPHWVAVLEWLACFDRIDFEYVPRTTPQIQVCHLICQRLQVGRKTRPESRWRWQQPKATGAAA